MNNKIKNIVIGLVLAIAVTGGLFVYEVNKEHHYTPKTAEILVENREQLKTEFIMKDNETAQIALAQKLSFVSDVENGTANLESTKKVFGFYECEINRVYDEYNPAVTYTISDSSIAQIDENGVITAVTKGEAVVTVTADEISTDIPLTVYKAVEIVQLEQDVVLLKGERKSFLSLGEYEVVLSEFYSTDEKVVAVNRNGTATAVGKGKAEVFTYKDEAKTEKISTKVTVKQPVESLSMAGITLYVGDSATLKATYKPRNADYGTNISYKTSDSTVAGVNGNVVTALKAGETTITATSANGVKIQTKLTVLTPPKATPTVTTITKAEFDAYGGEKFTDYSPYDSYFKITFDQPVLGFMINYVNDTGTSKTIGDAIYNNAQVPANTPLYFAVCINTSDVFHTRGFSYTNRDGSKVSYGLHFSGWDGSVIKSKY